MNLARPIWPAYALGLCLIAALCFGNLHTHLLDTHDADSFSDHLQIQQDGAFFFSPDKAQASGRPGNDHGLPIKLSCHVFLPPRQRGLVLK